MNIIKQSLKFLKGLINKEVIKRIIKIIRIDVTDLRIINYVKFYKIVIKVIKSHEVLK